MYSFFLFSAVFLFLAGLLYRCFAWLPKPHMTASPEPKGMLETGPTMPKKFNLSAMGNGILLIPRFLANILFQFEILKKSALRWFMHMLIFWGFMGLLVLHAFSPMTSENWFNDFYSTLNPYMFIRNLFGFMVIIGITGAYIRRRLNRIVKPLTTKQDLGVLLIILAIILSGNVLEAVKITSETEFETMTVDWAGIEDTDDMLPLKVFWSAEFGLVCKDPSIKGSTDLMAEGREMHEESCAQCHSKPSWAFVSYPIAKAISPFAVFLDRINKSGTFWVIHVGLCLIGLVYLPFGKMFHVISSPIHFGFKKRRNISQEQLIHHSRSPWQIALDACVNCGTCSVNCSVAPAYDVYDNKLVLPSERMKVIRKWARKGKFTHTVLMALRQGNELCTGCNRCSDVCPSGIDTLTISQQLCEKILEEHLIPMPDREMQENLEGSDSYFKSATEKTRITIGKPTGNHDDLLKVEGNMSACYTCKTCSSACPVVGHAENYTKNFGLAPHQIMHAVSIGLIDMAIHSRMIWDCTTCYACQEGCPQGVNITEILYQLKNQAIKQYSDLHPDAPVEISVPVELAKEVTI